jgi:hypothetical protein
LSEKELSFVLMGLTAKVQGKENKDLSAFQEKLRGIAQARMEKKSDR